MNMINGIAGLTLVLAAGAAHAEEAADPLAAILAGKPLLDVRLRSEQVEQTGKLDADALTLRTRAGWRTEAWRGLSGLVEVENVAPYDQDSYNSGVNGRTQYAGVSDPDVTDLNRLQLTYAPSEAFELTVGRQAIMLDDQRFVGRSNWRQDDTTYDAVRLDARLGATKLIYAYVDQANRGLARDGDFDTDAHLFNLSYAAHDAFTLTGFVYAIGIQEPQSAFVRSSLTSGLRATGSLERGKAGLEYAVSAATQEDWRNNPGSYQLDAYEGELVGSFGPLAAEIGLRAIEGDGVNMFATPFGSAHGVLGWADAFNATGAQTTVNGLRDRYLGATFKPDLSVGSLGGFKAQIVRHDFEADRTDADFGSEWDGLVSASVAKKATLGVKLADYEAGDRGSPASRRKVWLYLEYKL